ncbi:MAG: hypothetical protein NTZ25_01560 [Candidatus Peregrinibacteria bacterium]|nr:hypothetical protein [Candidatus Peregrinibacteria bacterium]
MSQKTCKNCTHQFEVTNEDIAFYKQVSPTFNNQKIQIPEPTLCPDCRQQRRLASCNEQNLYRTQCDLCHKSTLTQFPPNPKQGIYCRECWHSNDWDPCAYGKDFDFSRSFFEQVYELKRNCPTQALSIDGINVNSDYMHYAGSSKNSYLISHADFCEDCYYGYGFKHNICCVDGFYNLHCELCYDCVDVHKCYGLKGSQDCVNCSSSSFLKDCIGCKNCFLCIGLRNQEYCFKNKNLSKEEYDREIAKIDLGSYKQYQVYKDQLKQAASGYIFKEFHGHNTENCFGDYLVNCKNAKHSFDCEDNEDVKFCYQTVLGAKNNYDIYQYGTNLSESYECIISGGNSYHLLFTNEGTINCSNLIYCWYMEVSKNCFGCTSMHHKEYCILNKQYTKEEYEKLVPKILEQMIKTQEWGEYFSPAQSLFGYNKTTAQLYYPLTKEEAVNKGYKWEDYEAPQPGVKNIIKATDLPDNIKDVKDEVLEVAIECPITKKVFKIIPQELKFYRQQKIPLPHFHYEQRHLERFKQRNPRKFWQRNCQNCQKNIQTTYSPDRSEKIYCEECYMSYQS